jgi:Ca2+-transporting ATPase
MAGRALRVLGSAYRDLPHGTKAKEVSADVERELVFVGLAGMYDPPRPEAREAVRRCHNAGIRVVMITGDHPHTALAIARELGIAQAEDSVVSGAELNRLSDGELRERALRVAVYARVTAEHKLRIIRAWKANDAVVAMTGDGVNDAPALRRADIGIAMGAIGTDVAKETADLVLTDDNLGTIVHAIEEGRTIFANITKFVHLMFSHNLGEVIAVFVAVVSGMPLPLLPLQILWVNVATDVFPAFALALEPPLPQRMREPPQPAASLLTPSFLALIAWQAAMLAAIVLGAYQWALFRYGVGPHARTVALCTMVAVEVGHKFNCRSRTQSAFEGITKNPYLWYATAIVIALQVAAVAFPPLMHVLDVTRPSALDVAIITGGGLLPIAIVELQKFVSKRGPS